MILEAWIIGVHLHSWHPDVPPKNIPNSFDRIVTVNNDNTYGLYAISPSGAAFGIVRNSQFSTSIYIAQKWDFGPINVFTGVITGYQEARILPLVALGAELYGVRLNYIPKYKDKVQAVTLSVEYKF